jgi:hypothetical protein
MGLGQLKLRILKNPPDQKTFWKDYYYEPHYSLTFAFHFRNTPRHFIHQLLLNLIKICLASPKNRVPDHKLVSIISNIHQVMEIMEIRGPTPRENPIRAERELVPTMPIHSLKYSNNQKLAERCNMNRIRQQQQAHSHRNSIAQNILNRVRANRTDGNRLLRLMVHFVHIRVNPFGMEKPMHPVKAEVLNHQHPPKLNIELSETWELVCFKQWVRRFIIDVVNRKKWIQYQNIETV